jgi:Fe-S-cluster formation regulator IscX/YfhJ
MRRRNFLWAMGGAASSAAVGVARAADAQQQIFDLFTKIASALSDDDPAMFIEAVDPGMPNFQDFRRDVVALTDLADVTNSIEVLSDSGDDTHRAEELDWFLEIVGKSDPHPLERRREVVKFRLERKGKKWKIVSIEPLHFFAPPKIT